MSIMPSRDPRAAGNTSAERSINFTPLDPASLPSLYRVPRVRVHSDGRRERVVETLTAGAVRDSASLLLLDPSLDGTPLRESAERMARMGFPVLLAQALLTQAAVKASTDAIIGGVL